MSRVEGSRQRAAKAAASVPEQKTASEAPRTVTIVTAGLLSSCVSTSASALTVMMSRRFTAFFAPARGPFTYTTRAPP
jgi:hypothetical protein